MSIKIIFWIIVGILYLITQMRKKAEPPTSRPKTNPTESETFDKPLTFDELLREIQTAKSPKPQPVPVTDYVDYDDEIEEDAKPFERVDYQKEDKIYETYEKARQEAFVKPSMEETLKLQNTIVRFGQFKNYAQEEKPNLAAEFANDLRDPNNFRKAFVLSEILNRRF